MNKREIQLLEELAVNHYTCRECGGAHYPLSWMTKTREKLVREGVLKHVVCRIVTPERIALRIVEQG
jgi:NMD protein affecting ribosome stability and mRNA decay